MPPTFSQTASPFPSSPHPFTFETRVMESSSSDREATDATARSGPASASMPGVSSNPPNNPAMASSTPDSSFSRKASFGNQSSAAFSFGASSSTAPSTPAWWTSSFATPPSSAVTFGSTTALPSTASLVMPKVEKKPDKRLLEDMFLSGAWSDVIVKTTEPKEFKLHKAVLCGASSWFKKFCEVSAKACQ